MCEAATKCRFEASAEESQFYKMLKFYRFSAMPRDDERHVGGLRQAVCLHLL